MIASDSARLLFVHVQKTGGVSIHRHLVDALPDARSSQGRPYPRHATYAQILEAEPALADYWSFGFVRNPWARLYSWYQMIERQRLNYELGRPGVIARVDSNPFWSDVVATVHTFEQFVLEAPERHERLRIAQLDYLRHGDRTVDFVGRTESLSDDLRRVFEQHGLPPVVEVEHANSSPRRDYAEHFTPEMRARVADVFAADVEEFGYAF